MKPNGEHRKPHTVQAWIEGLDESATLVRAREMKGWFDDHWRCGRCGQLIRLDLGHGWRFDGTVWRPTEYHLRHRRRAEDRLQDRSLSATDRARERDRLASNQFARSRERPYVNRDEEESRGTGTHRFPKNAAECPRCRAINVLNPAALTYRLIEPDVE